MRADEVRTLFDYNYWANARVLDAAAKLTDADLASPARASHGSLLGTLAHVLAAEWVWRMRCQSGASPAALPTAADFPTLAALRNRWQAEERETRAFLAGLGDADLVRVVRYTNTRGTPFENPLWELLVHVVNHGTQFRSEAAVLLTERGQSPGDLDFIAYLRERRP